MGSLSDDIGRRPLYLACFTIYIASNIGLALQDNYAALLVLRCLQSSGSSGTVALANAVVSDIVTSAERGSYISYVSMGAMVGPAFGPVIGGLLDHYLGWKAIFWFLTIFSGVVFLIFIIALPETCRKVAGNGSLQVQRWNVSLLSYYHLRKQRNEGEEGARQSKLGYKKRPSLFNSLYILFDKESGIVLIYAGMFFAGFYMIAASIPVLLERQYGFNTLQIGLCYIPAGFGSLAASLVMGRFLDWNFRRHARLCGQEISNSRQQDLRHFPIEAARLQVVFPMVFLTAGSVIAYGWLMEYQVFLAGPLIFLFLSAFFVSGSFQGLSTLIVDLNRDSPSSATAAMNLARCWLGAGSTAAVIPLINAIGIGWTSVIVAGIFALLSPIVPVVIQRGPRWREDKRMRLERQREPSRQAEA